MKTLRYVSLIATVALTVSILGCSSGMPEQTIEVKASNDPLNAPRSILKRYSEGQPLGSETTSFPKMVEDVRKIDPSRAEVLEKGLADIQQAGPGSRAGLAKGLLAKLQPSMK